MLSARKKHTDNLVLNDHLQDLQKVIYKTDGSLIQDASHVESSDRSLPHVKHPVLICQLVLQAFMPWFREVV